MHLHIYRQISYSVILPIPRVHGVKHLNVYFFHHGKTNPGRRSFHLRAVNRWNKLSNDIRLNFSTMAWLHIYFKMPSVLINADTCTCIMISCILNRPFVHLYVYTFKPNTMLWLCILHVCTRTVNHVLLYIYTCSVEYNNVLIWTSWKTSTLYWKRYPE